MKCSQIIHVSQSSCNWEKAMPARAFLYHTRKYYRLLTRAGRGLAQWPDWASGRIPGRHGSRVVDCTPHG